MYTYDESQIFIMGNTNKILKPIPRPAMFECRIQTAYLYYIKKHKENQKFNGYYLISIKLKHLTA